MYQTKYYGWVSCQLTLFLKSPIQDLLNSLAQLMANKYIHILCKNDFVGGLESHLSDCFQFYAPKFCCRKKHAATVHCLEFHPLF